MKRLLAAALAIVLLAVGCNDKKASPTIPVKVEQKIEYEESLNIMTSNKQLYNMVKDIVGDRHNVDYMIKDEADQWNFKFTSDSVSNISNKDIFIYTGTDFEPWANDFVNSLKKGNVAIVDCSRGIKPSKLTVPRLYGDKKLEQNPYYWLDTDYFKIALFNIKNAIEEKDPENRKTYEENFNNYLKKIDEFKKSQKDSLSSLKDYTFLEIGDNLDYLTKELGLKVTKLDQLGENQDIDGKIQELLNDNKQMIFIYNDVTQLNSVNYTMDKYKIKEIAITAYSPDLSYLDLLKKNYNALTLVLKK